MRVRPQKPSGDYSSRTRVRGEPDGENARSAQSSCCKQRQAERAEVAFMFFAQNLLGKVSATTAAASAARAAGQLGKTVHAIGSGLAHVAFGNSIAETNVHG